MPETAKQPTAWTPATPDALALWYAGAYRGALRYVAAWKRWMAWDGKRWRADDTLLAADHARTICGRAAGRVREDAADARTAARLQERLAGAALPAQVERLARADRALAAEPHQWDRDPDLLNTPAGIIDTRTGEALPHAPEAYMTRLAAVAPAAPGTPHPLWSRFLDRVTGGDAELAFYLQRVAGYVLTGRTGEHAVFFVHGPGASGKSTFLGTLARILGDYAGVMAADGILGSPARLASAIERVGGARLATVEDVSDGECWSAARIKALAGGDAAPRAKFLVACNDPPRLGRVDEAVARRLHLVPFAGVPRSEREPDLVDRLAAEHAAILRWAIDGALAWRRIGLAPPPAVRAARDAHLADEDSLAQWLAEGTEPSPSGWASSAALYAGWRQWCRDAGEAPGSQKRFSRMLAARGFAPKRRRSGHRGFLGLALRPEPAAALLDDLWGEMAERMRDASSVIAPQPSLAGMPGEARPWLAERPEAAAPQPARAKAEGGSGGAPIGKERGSERARAAATPPPDRPRPRETASPTLALPGPSGAGPFVSRATRGRGAENASSSVIRHRRASVVPPEQWRQAIRHPSSVAGGALLFGSPVLAALVEGPPPRAGGASISISSSAKLRLLPCASSASDTVTPPPSAAWPTNCSA